LNEKRRYNNLGACKDILAQSSKFAPNIKPFPCDSTIQSQSRTLRPLPPRPDSLPIEAKEKRNRHHSQRHEPQQANRPIDTQLIKHLICKQREHACKYTPHQRHRRKRARGIRLEGINEIGRRALEDAKESEAHERRADARPNPVNARIAGPSEDEDAYDIDDGAEHHRPQTGFGHGSVVIGMEAREVEALVV
jgi:hypothetical protein